MCYQIKVSISARGNANVLHLYLPCGINNIEVYLQLNLNNRNLVDLFYCALTHTVLIVHWPIQVQVKF